MKRGTIEFEVIVGTYEEFVLGYQFILDEESGKGELTQSFATHSHRASVRAVASRGKLVVSGGADETINIYNMFSRKECGMLMEHNGTITSLNFTPDCSHVISTSEDGSIKIFRQGSWQLEKIWPNAHKGTAVTCLSVHPSGKMALSVGKDHTLRTWNLVKGRPAYTTNLYSRCRQLEMVLWSPEGTLFAVPMDTKVEVTSTQKAGVLHTLELSSKVTACTFVSEEVICVGEACGTVSAFSTQSAQQLWKLSRDQRIRGLAYLRCYLVSTTSSGEIRVYSVTDASKQPRFVTSADCGCRITCVALYDFKSEVQVKKEPSDEKAAQDNTKKKRRCSSESEKTPDQKKTDSPSKKLKEKNEKINSVKTDSPSKKLKDKSDEITSVEVMCSPRTQKWVVEDSKR